MILLFIPPHNNMGLREKEVSAYFKQHDVIFRGYLLPAENFLESKGNYFVYYKAPLTWRAITLNAKLTCQSQFWFAASAL